MKRALLPVLAISVLVGCQDRTDPTSPFENLPPAAALLDGANGGLDGFWFLPPLVRNPGATAPNDDTKDPTVRVCLLSDTPCESGDAVVEFTSVPVVAQHYQVDWNTGGSGLQNGESYRIWVLIGDEEVVGFIDIFVAANRGQSNAAPEGFFGIVNGQNVPIKFRISADVQGISCENDCVITTVTDDQDDPVCTPAQLFCLDPSPDWLPDPFEEVILTIEQIEPDGDGNCVDLPLPQGPFCYRVQTFPQVVGEFESIVGIGLCPDFDATEEYYQIHQIHDNGDVERPAEGDEPAGLDCDEPPVIGLLPTAKRAFRDLRDFVFGTPLYARDGFGAQITSFSEFFWAATVQLYYSFFDDGEFNFVVAEGHLEDEFSVDGVEGVTVFFSLSDSDEAPIADLGSDVSDAFGAVSVDISSLELGDGSYILTISLPIDVNPTGSPPTFCNVEFDVVEGAVDEGAVGCPFPISID